MTAYALRDLVRGPSLLSLLRLPLTVGFVFAALEQDTAWPWAVLVASAASDLLDGWYARRSGQVTKTGALLDGVMDKLFVGVVVVTLVATERLSIVQALALGTRDVGELVILARLAAGGRGRLGARRRALPTGKVTTLLQYLTVALAVARIPGTVFLVGLTAATGVLAAFDYWRAEGTTREDHT